MKPLSVALVGCGAIGTAVLESLHEDADIRIDVVLASARSHDRAREAIARWAPRARVLEQLGDVGADVLVECAGHGAIEEHVLPALVCGIPCLVASVGALALPGLAQRLEAAARRGGAQVQLVAGAIGAVDALAAARIGGLDAVTYVGTKPPRAWKGTPAERECDLDALATARVVFSGHALDAARLYPKNANVAATLAFAGLGLERTRVELVADPATEENVHRVEARGAFGSFELTLRGRPLAANPKTSALTVYSLVRALRNRVRPVSI